MQACTHPDTYKCWTSNSSNFLILMHLKAKEFSIEKPHEDPVLVHRNNVIGDDNSQMENILGMDTIELPVSLTSTMHCIL